MTAAKLKPAWYVAALTAAAASGYGGRVVQVEARYGESLPTDAAGWDCTSRPKLPDGTAVCFPKPETVADAQAAAARAAANVPQAWACADGVCRLVAAPPEPERPVVPEKVVPPIRRPARRTPAAKGAPR